MRLLTRRLLAAPGLFTALLLFAPQAMAACVAPAPGFICGVTNAEDLVRLPGTKWVVASQLIMDIVPSTPPQYHYKPGPVVAVRTDSHAVSTIFAGGIAVDWDRKSFPDCDRPPSQPTSHGLNVRTIGKGKFRLYVVNHGDRQSIEIVDLIDQGATLSATWRGCLLVEKAGAGIRPNAVAPLADGGLLVAGGGVARWHPDGGWTRIGAFKNANGIEITKDGGTIFVADAAESKAVIWIDAAHPDKTGIIKLDFVPDNVRWGDDGLLYVAGAFFPPGYTMQQIFACIAQPVCSSPFVIARIDPRDRSVSEVFRSGPRGLDGAFGNATTALTVGDRLWVGTVKGDSIALLPRGR